MTGEKRKVAVLFGGASSEHEVSRMSAASIIEHLNSEIYEVYIIGITKAGKWLSYCGDTKGIADGSWEFHPDNAAAYLLPDATIGGILRESEGKTEIIPIDVVFPVLHGRNGEDGTMQGLLQLSGIPYVGCDTLSSAVCMDKAVAHTLLAAANIEQAHYLWFFIERYRAASDTIKKKISARLNYPVFVKPANAGSSVGVSRVECEDDLDAAVNKAALEDDKIVVEEGVVGQEVECAVMGNSAPIASVPGEICSGAAFYDYEDKYVNGVSKLHIPAQISDAVSERVKEIALRAYWILGCRGLARVDFFVTPDQRIVLNEINTLPGFTAISMYPKLWMHMGMSYSEILDQLIAHAMIER